MSVLLILHVAVSLIAIAAGVVVAAGFVANRRVAIWNEIFLVTTIATSLSGFPLPADRFLPSHAIGILSLITLTAAVVARFRYRRARRSLYMVTALTAFYFNAFVLVLQGFRHVPLLHNLAPTQTELPFAIAQLALLIGFLALIAVSLRRYHRSFTVAV